MTAKRNLESVEIPRDVEEQLEEIPDTKIGAPRVEWQPWQDKVLLEHWTRKPKREVARILGYSEEICRRRYRELVQQKGSGQ